MTNLEEAAAASAETDSAVADLSDEEQARLMRSKTDYLDPFRFPQLVRALPSPQCHAYEVVEGRQVRGRERLFAESRLRQSGTQTVQQTCCAVMSLLSDAGGLAVA